MSKIAVVQTGGKQYMVRENDLLTVGKVIGQENDAIELETLAVFDEEKDTLEMGMPLLKTTLKATIVGHVKADKIRVARFKSKVRTRKVTGHRADLTNLKIGAI